MTILNLFRFSFFHGLLVLVGAFSAWLSARWLQLSPMTIASDLIVATAFCVVICMAIMTHQFMITFWQRRELAPSGRDLAKIQIPELDIWFILSFLSADRGLRV